MVRKVFSKQSQEFSNNIGFDILAVWLIEPYDVLFSSFTFDGARVADVLQCTGVFALAHCLTEINISFKLQRTTSLTHSLCIGSLQIKKFTWSTD